MLNIDSAYQSTEYYNKRSKKFILQFSYLL